MIALDQDEALAERAPALRGLLGSIEGEEFLSQVWERRHALSRRSLASTVNSLLTVADFERLMASAPTGPGSWLNIVDRLARPLLASSQEAEALTATYWAYARGSTLLLIDLQRRWPPLTRFCRALEVELLSLGVRLSHRMGANAYLTPANSQGFGLHYDDHCVFVVQLSGRKQWSVHAPLTPLPIGRCEGTISPDSLGPPILEAELGPGDVLYIPRGFPHEARTAGSSSLHVTISLQTVTWVELIREALKERPELRRSLPPGRGSAQALYDRELAPLCLVEDVDARIEHKTGKLVTSLCPLAQGRLAAIDAAAGIGPATKLYRAPGSVCVVSREGDEAVIRFPGATLRLPAVMEDALAFVATRRAFSTADIPAGRAVFDPVDLARLLIREGLLSVSLDGHAGDLVGPEPTLTSSLSRLASLSSGAMAPAEKG